MVSQVALLAIWWVLVTGPCSGANVIPQPAPPPAFLVPLVLLLALPGRLLVEIPGSPFIDRMWLVAAFNLPF